MQAGRPLVALESTIITHGMPYPQNVATALEVEAVVRAEGAEPATIAILDGVPHIGLTREQLERLGTLGPQVRKTSRRDLPFVLSQKLNGSTTVSATMILAAMAGIQIFVTGGIGGVHRGGETSMDVSADLTELARTPVAVVCAGAKSVLDIGRTLEFLETQGVCVAAYGADEFPAFFTPSSGFRAPCRVDCPEDAARLMYASLQVGLNNGVLVGVPPPIAQGEEGFKIQSAIDLAVQEAQEKGIAGAEVTPFLLERVNQISKGSSLAVNIALIKNNAKVGSRMAMALLAMSKN